VSLYLCEAKSAPRALWIEKSTKALHSAKSSLISASGEAQGVSDCETSSVLLRTQLRFSHEAKGKALISAISEAVVASLCTTKAFVGEAKSEAHPWANSKLLRLKKEYFTVLKHQVLR